MRLTARDQRFINRLHKVFGDKLHVVIDDVIREYGRAGVRRPGGQNAIDTYVVHHTAGPRNATWRNIWDYHTRTKKWSTGGYGVLFDQYGNAYLTVPPSRMTYGAGDQNPVTYHGCAIGNYETHEPSEVMLDSIFKWLWVSDKELGYKPWRPHSDIRSTACPGKYLTPHVWDMSKRGALVPCPVNYRD